MLGCTTEGFVPGVGVGWPEVGVGWEVGGLAA